VCLLCECVHCVGVCACVCLCLCVYVVALRFCCRKLYDTVYLGLEYQVLGNWRPEMPLPFQVLMELHWHCIPRFSSPAYNMLERAQYLFVLNMLDLGYRPFYSGVSVGGRGRRARTRLDSAVLLRMRSRRSGYVSICQPALSACGRCTYSLTSSWLQVRYISACTEYMNGSSIVVGQLIEKTFIAQGIYLLQSAVR
jgi:hypothetical protein